MTTKLQEAITATRNGNKVEAQRLLADLLKDDTNNVQAWYLLSLLVESEEKKRTYLGRVLSLDPEHEKAKELLTTIDGLPLVESEEIDQNAGFGGENLPTWLDEAAEDVPDALLVEEEPSEIFNDALPTWLSSDHAAMEIQDEPPTLLSESPPAELAEMLDEYKGETAVSPTSEPLEIETAVSSTSSPAVNPQLRWWNNLLVLLWILLIIVFVAFVIQLINAF